MQKNDSAIKLELNNQSVLFN